MKPYGKGHATPDRGGCERTDWDRPCSNVDKCGRASECVDKYKTGLFPRKGLKKFGKK